MINKKYLVGMFFLVGIFLIGIGTAQSFSSSNPQYTSFGGGSSSYLSGQGIQLYGGSGVDSSSCGAGQDFVLQIHPMGCSPSVIRSDLLEEQNVAVFCPIVATQVNPLITIKAIDSMTFSGQYPPQVSGVGFHPAQAAVRSQNQLLNYPVLDNVGYAVIVLKRNENESSMPDYVVGNLTAKIKYDINNAFGIGDASFYIPYLRDSEWQDRFQEFGFWNGKGFLKVEDIRESSANIGIYENQNNGVSSFNLNIGQTSSKVYLRDSYCLSGVSVKLDGLENPDTRVKLKIDDGYLELKRGERFLENRCVVNSLDKNGIVQSTKIICSDDSGQRKELNFDISPSVNLNVSGKNKNYLLGDSFNISDKNYTLVYMDVKDNLLKKENLVVWIANFSEEEKSRYLSDGKLNSNGKIYFNNLIKRSKESDYLNNKLVKNNVWRVKYNDETTLTGTDKIKLNGFGVPEISEVNSANNFGDNYNNAISNYSEIVKQFPLVRPADQYGTEISGVDSFAVSSLKKSIELAELMKDYNAVSELTQELERMAPTSANKAFILEKTKDYLYSSSGDISQTISVSGKYRTISFLGIYEPDYEDYGVEISLTGTDITDSIVNPIPLSKNYNLNLEGNKFIQLVDLKENEAIFETNIEATDINARSRVSVKLGETKVFTSGKDNSAKTVSLNLRKINLNKIVKVSVVSNIDRAGTEANINFKIGIEKRNIQLSPKKIDEKIKNLNETVTKWEERSEKLGNVVDGLQKACVASAGILAVKNLLFGGGTDVEARKMTMESVRAHCRNEIANKRFANERDCIDASGDLINQIQGINTAIIENSNNELAHLSNEKNSSKYLEEFAKIVSRGKSDSEIGNITLAAQNKLISVDDLKTLRYCDQLKVKDLTLWNKECNATSKKIMSNLFENVQAEEFRKKSEVDLQNRGLIGGIPSVDHYADKDAQTGTWRGTSLNSDKIKNVAEKNLFSDTTTNKNIQFITYNSKEYVAILGNSPNSNSEYSAEKVCAYAWNKNNNLIVNESDCITNNFKSFKKVGSFTTPITNPEVRYFGSAPNLNYPAVVPFPFPGNQRRGFYVGIRHLVFGSSATASGAPRSYWVCNAGDDGIVNFAPESSEFTGGDSCAQFRIEGGVIIGGEAMFGLSTSEINQLAAAANKAILEAQRQHGKSRISIFGMDMVSGAVAFDTPTMQCQDYMSPSDCAWLYNLCDPVICPSSRCDFGGTKPTANVPQSGIIGSLLLCLPNFGSPSEGKVLIPVCLSGLKAGIDGYVSIVKSHRDCLIEKQTTGKTVGICDEIYSVYLCDMFWREASPLKDFIIPKILDIFSGRSGNRGGGEYLGADASWTNTKNTLNFFTQNYASNAYNAFKNQAVTEIRHEVCKNSLSSVFPEIAVLGQMTEPASPPQFHAKFSEIPFTDATIPPTSQYSVFYHIFAGQNNGAQYQVYLKSPEGQSIYSISPTYIVGGGYVAIGGTASEKRDFVAPSGYRELCVRVNNQEECGFKEVSTSFAIDWITDKIVSEEAENTQVKTEFECTSGQRVSGGSLVRAISDSSLSRDLYSEGIVRVCSSQVPDGNTQSSKWKEVGYCDDPSVKCWIDTNSVKKAIEFSDIEGNTLNKINENAMDKLFNEKEVMTLEKYNFLIDELKRDLILESSLKEIPNKVDSNLNNVLFDWQKAQLIFIKASAWDLMTRAEKAKKDLSNFASVSVSTSDDGEDEFENGDILELQTSSRIIRENLLRQEIIEQENNVRTSFNVAQELREAISFYSSNIGFNSFKDKYSTLVSKFKINPLMNSDEILDKLDTELLKAEDNETLQKQILVDLNMNLINFQNEISKANSDGDRDDFNNKVINSFPVPSLDLKQTGFFVDDKKVTSAKSTDDIIFKVEQKDCNSIQYSLVKDVFLLSWVRSKEINGFEDPISDIEKQFNNLPVGDYVIDGIICKDSIDSIVSNLPQEFRNKWKLKVTE